MSIPVRNKAFVTKASASCFESKLSHIFKTNSARSSYTARKKVVFLQERISLYLSLYISLSNLYILDLQGKPWFLAFSKELKEFWYNFKNWIQFENKIFVDFLWGVRRVKGQQKSNFISDLDFLPKSMRANWVLFCYIIG